METVILFLGLFFVMTNVRHIVNYSAANLGYLKSKKIFSIREIARAKIEAFGEVSLNAIFALLLFFFSDGEVEKVFKFIPDYAFFILIAVHLILACIYIIKIIPMCNRHYLRYGFEAKFEVVKKVEESTSEFERKLNSLIKSWNSKAGESKSCYEGKLLFLNSSYDEKWEQIPEMTVFKDYHQKYVSFENVILNCDDDKELKAGEQVDVKITYISKDFRKIETVLE